MRRVETTGTSRLSDIKSNIFSWISHYNRLDHVDADISHDSFFN